MDALASLAATFAAAPLMPVALLLLVLGGAAMLVPALSGGGGRSELKRRLKVEVAVPAAAEAAPQPKKGASAVREKAARTAQDFYSRSDPENVARLRLKLIQAGYMDPRAVGMFFLIRFAAFAAGAGLALLADGWVAADATSMSRWTFVILAGAAGYFLPGLVLS
jgi:tight adherence protein C